MSYEYLKIREWCHATLCERGNLLKTLGSVASYLENGNF